MGARLSRSARGGASASSSPAAAAVSSRANSGKAMTHFVLGVPLEFDALKTEHPEAGVQRVVFGSGCFWGTEKLFWRLPGVLSTAVAYSGGSTDCPSYDTVCSGNSGHAETVQVIYDENKISFGELLKMFWECHDPTQGNAQGNDRGSQYRSVLYYTTDRQRDLAFASKTAYEQALKERKKGLGDHITTEVKELGAVHLAEAHHQQYLARPGSRPYCSAQPQGVALPRIQQWLPPQYKDVEVPLLSELFWAKHAPKPGCVLNAPNEKIAWKE